MNNNKKCKKRKKKIFFFNLFNNYYKIKKNIFVVNYLTPPILKPPGTL